MTPSSAANSYVSVPIPVRHYDAVMQALAAATAAEAPSSTAATSDASRWTQAELSELAGRANAMTLAILDLGAHQPGELVSIRDAEAHAGVSRGVARGQLAGLTQLVRRRFKRQDWPFEVRWAAGGEKIAYYVVSDTVAKLWRAVRA